MIHTCFGEVELLLQEKGDETEYRNEAPAHGANDVEVAEVESRHLERHKEECNS